MLTGPSDMANIALDWEVDGILTPPESVSAMIKVITSRSSEDSGTFWTWEGKVEFTCKRKSQTQWI